MAGALSLTELLPLVDALADSQWHSGEALAETAGISRAALAKRIEKLRDWGLEFEARQGLGYRLVQPLERLSQGELQACVPASLTVRVATEIDSTNRALLDADAAQDPQALFAEYQSAGRGRRGREWRSPFAANLYLSLAWSFNAWPPQLTTLPLAIGVACARALRAVGADGVRLKWPNDLYLDGRKLGGILIEHRGEAGGLCRVVIGIGLNVAMSKQQGEGIDQSWISLDQSLTAAGRPAASRNALATVLLGELHALLSGFEHERAASWRTEWDALDLTRDRVVNVLGTAPFSGTARGIDEVGALRVQLPEGEIRAVHSGDVSLRLA